MTTDQLRELRRLADRAEGAAIALREALDEAVAASQPDDTADHGRGCSCLWCAIGRIAT